MLFQNDWQNGISLCINYLKCPGHYEPDWLTKHTKFSRLLRCNTLYMFICKIVCQVCTHACSKEEFVSFFPRSSSAMLLLSRLYSTNIYFLKSKMLWFMEVVNWLINIKPQILNSLLQENTGKHTIFLLEIIVTDRIELEKVYFATWSLM